MSEIPASNSNLELIQFLAGFGRVIELDLHINCDALRAELKGLADKWHPYNPRKAIPRKGLSLVSLDGQSTGVPDLDSLREYNILNGTNYSEKSFQTPTELLGRLRSLTPIVEVFAPWLRRSHLLQLDRGGYFPPHRDAYGPNDGCFRLFAPLINAARNQFNFILDGKVLEFEPGRLYFVDTRLEHSLFSFIDESIHLVLNVELTAESVGRVAQHFNVK